MQRLVLSTLLTLILVNPVMAADPRVIEVSLDSYTITPDHIVVKVNQPVTLKVTNKATFIPHNLIIKAPEAGIDVKVEVRAGKSGEATFTQPRQAPTRCCATRSHQSSRATRTKVCTAC